MPQLTGNIVDLIRREIYPGTVTIADGRIARIDRFGNTLGTTETCRSCFRVLSTHTSTSKVRCSPRPYTDTPRWDTALSPLWPILTKSRTSAGPMESGTWSNKPGVRR